MVLLYLFSLYNSQSCASFKTIREYWGQLMGWSSYWLIQVLFASWGSSFGGFALKELLNQLVLYRGNSWCSWFLSVLSCQQIFSFSCIRNQLRTSLYFSVLSFFRWHSSVYQSTLFYMNIVRLISYHYRPNL